MHEYERFRINLLNAGTEINLEEILHIKKDLSSINVIKIERLKQTNFQ